MLLHGVQLGFNPICRRSLAWVRRHAVARKYRRYALGYGLMVLLLYLRLHLRPFVSSQFIKLVGELDKSFV